MSNQESKDWHETESQAETEAFSHDFWKRHSEDLAAGRFWADRIKAFRGEPVKRLQVAIDNLPLPAAFREAAVAVRTLIRQCRKEIKSYDDHLLLLYWLAAVNSFSKPYSEKLREPGYNVLESIPGSLLKTLPFSYSELGLNRPVCSRHFRAC